PRTYTLSLHDALPIFPRKSHLLRPRSYEAHFTAKHVPQLRQLVQTQPADDAPDTGSALIVVRCELGSALLCVDSHRTKLHQTEGTAVLPDSLLPEENRPPRVDPDGSCKNQAQGHRDRKADKHGEHVEHSFQG